MPVRKKDNKTFVKLANKRVESCQHTPVQVATMFKAIRKYVDDAEKAFIDERKPQEKFSLE